MKKSNQKIITYAVVLLMLFQLFISMNPPLPAQGLKVLGAIVMFFSIFLTAWKQKASTTISDKTMVGTWILFGAAIVGGINDVLSQYLFDFGEVANTWIRFTITFLTTALNALSKIATEFVINDTDKD